MANMNQELERANVLTARARDVYADQIESERLAKEVGAEVKRLEEHAKAMPLHWRERQELEDATRERDRWLTKATEAEKQRQDLNSEANKAFTAQGRAGELRTQYGLNDAEMEQVFTVYFEGGTYAEAKRKAAELAAKAKGKISHSGGGGSSEGGAVYAFNKPGNIRW